MPDQMSGEIEIEHCHRYFAAAELVAGLDVLDIASGEGYGSAHLALVAKAVIGVDISDAAVSFAQRNYASTRSNLRYVQGSCASIPVADASVDAVVSFETIEHHTQHEEMMREIKRVLRPDGLLIISSPDKHEYSDVPRYSNPYHVRELYKEEFGDLLMQWFSHVRLYGQRVYHGSSIFPLSKLDSGSVVASNYLLTGSDGNRTTKALVPLYFVAVASDRAVLPDYPVGVLASTQEEERLAALTAEHQKQATELGALHGHIAHLQRELDVGQTRIDTLLAQAERDSTAIAKLPALQHELEVGQTRIDTLLAQAERKSTVIAELSAYPARVERLTREVEQMRNARGYLALSEANFRARAEWLTREVEQMRSAKASLEERMERTEAAALAENETLRRANAEILLSTSWRITLPLRAAKRLLRWARRSGRRHVVSRSVADVRATGADDGVAAPHLDVAEMGVHGSNDAFDAAYYLRCNPDVARSGVDPYSHYVSHGKQEGRICVPPELVFSAGGRTLAVGRQTVLVVSHEASRTGAPILAWNICRELAPHYNVVALLLGSGAIRPFFEDVCHVVVGPYDYAVRTPAAIDSIIGRLCERYEFDFALVNSIESRCVVKPLAERFVPAVLLVHEFFAYSRPRHEFVSALRWAGGVVFPADVVRQNAATHETEKALRLTNVLPQGKSLIPVNHDTALGDPFADLQAKLHPANETGRPFIVLGAGSVQYRKGVDLFIATAAKLKQLAPDADILMLWIGHGYDPENDLAYSAYLADEIDRAGLGDRVRMLKEVEDLESAYALAHTFYLSSRLDPLPNVAIDSMMLGMPLVCFAEATGAAEVLAKDPATAPCVVPFLDTDAAARRILDLYHSPAQLTETGRAVGRLARSTFDMQSYVSKLTAIAQDTRALMCQEKEDCETLEATDDFCEEFFVDPASPLTTRAEAIRSFVRACSARLCIRKPAPGFNTSMYATLCDTGTQNPFAHFVRAGKPAGPWLEHTLTLGDVGLKGSGKQTLRAALHIHVFYPDALQNLVERLAMNQFACDLFISVPNEVVAAEVSAAVYAVARGHVDVRVVPNRGRDIGPFLTEFRESFSGYDVIGHVHTKKSVDLNDPVLAQRWSGFVLENLIGGRYAAADEILAHFGEQPRLGIVYADDPHLQGWSDNQSFGQALAERMGISSLPQGDFSFPVGTMFWARPQALQPLFDLALDWSAYPEEPLPYDGSMLHAIERLLPLVAEKQGYVRAVTHVRGVTR
ncbi:glycosyltransferase involved in cell wall biosynthesis/ubiquinone/menaquinone biosynthesis C-methylase UbiE/predicted nucleic acid-binding Zn-ribbon protein [Paraburkholderia terricola]|uniref:rhamnan synthesis F family protein n=2 Tax=Burkholderiaceae TaxID=119060 RepID=UPI00286795C2|nr:rhamnan synthesis F family protein [Paraburkholderia terricola]MDR6450271.1 glycosyltransferase involved in cell wall biosynthesis/ubiquinone/menaquinone biosynthesis C-methylase UbiE/predicted nucleic acid-binding Zn-ribbon protein [Paraburkholderia terricola]